MITPEPLERFRIAVPSEYEVNLLDALATVGAVHLESSLEAKSVLPPLLVDILEGKVTPQTLNIDEALEISRKVLRPNDVLLKQIEEKVDQYKHLLKIKKLAERLYEIGVSPEDIGKDKLGLTTDLIVVSEENLHDSLSSLLSIGAIVRRGRISDYEHFLLLIYKRELKAKVDEIKKLYAKRFELPPWFYDKQDIVLKRISEEELSIRNDIYSLLLEVAHVLRDAFEFEKSSRLEVIGNAYKALTELRKKKEIISDILYTYASLLLGSKECKENSFVLSRLKVRKEYCELVSSIRDEEVLSRSEIDKIVLLPPFKKDSENLKSTLTLFYKYLGIANLLNKMTNIEEHLSTPKQRLLVVYGEENLKELCEGDTLKLYGSLRIESGSIEWGHGCIIAAPETVVETLSEVLRSRYNALTFVVDEYKNNIETLKAEVIEKKQTVKNSLIVKMLKATLLYFKIDLYKIAQVLEDESFKELLVLYKQAFEEVQPKSLPIEDRFMFLRNLLSSIDGIEEDIRHLQEDINNILELPTELMPTRLQTHEVLLKDILQKIREYLSYESTIEAMYRTQPLLSEIRILRTRRITYVEGYVPSKYREALEREVTARVPRLLYLRFATVKRKEKAPSYIEVKGIKKYLYTLTSMRGTPSYWEIDPTLVFTGLFTLMYGMMFGDIGQGLLLALFGIFLLKTKYPLLGISREGAGTLGALASLAGASSIVFGSLYGFMFFLKPLGQPIISPIHDIYTIIAIALWFGVIQLMLAMLLNVINLVRFGDILGAIFSGMGGMGILFYSSGVVIAYRLATSGFNFTALNSPEINIFLWLIIFSLVGVIGFGFYEAKFLRHGERLMHAISEIVEMIIAFPANSLSYIRLAAFAMAHEAFGILAENMSLMTGELVSYIIANFLVLAIEALAVGIQALRLTYYEFSTKFFKGEGIEFRPVMPLINTKAE